MAPMVCGKGVAESAPTLTEVRTTLAAAVCPVLEMVSWTTTLPPLRVSTLVTTRLAGVEAAGLTVMVLVAVAVVLSVVLAGVKVTESVWLAPAWRTVPAGGL